MKKIKKILLITGIILGSILLIMILTPIIFKGKLLQLAKDQANENLRAKIEFADFKLSMFRHFPSLNLKITNLSIVGVDQFEGDTLTKMDYLSVDLNLMSVIKGNEIKIKSIILNKPDILIKILKDGSANYDIEIEDSTTIEETDTASTENEEILITLKKLQIIDGNFIYDDKESDIVTIFENMNFKLKGDFTEDITDIDFLLTVEKFTYEEDGIALINKAFLEFDSELNADLINYKYIFKENLLTLNEFQLAFDGWVAMPESDIDMDLTFSTKKTEFKSILSLVPAVYQSDFEGIETSGSISFDGYAKGTLNDILIPAFGINLLVENARFQYPDLPAAVENINIDCKITNPGNEDINTINIKKFHLEMAENPVDIIMLIESTASDVYLDGQVVAQLNLGKVNEFYPLEDMTLSGNLNTDIKIKGNLSELENESYDNFYAEGYLEITNLNSEIEDVPSISIEHSRIVFSPEFAELENFDAQIGNSDLHLVGRIDNIFQYLFNDELLTAEFNLTSELFDLNEFLFSETTEPVETEEEIVSDEEVETSAFEIPANLDFTLNSQVTKIYYDKLTLENFLGIIKIKDSKLELSELSMDLLKGSMLMTALYDANDYLNPLVNFSLELSEIDIKSTFLAFNTIQKLAPVLENCNGKVSANLEMSSNLDSYLVPVMNTINGNGVLITDNISISGNKVFTTLANLTKQEKYREPGIKDLNLAFEIIDGNIEIKPTDFMLANTKASIQGTTNLDQSINYQLGITLPQTVAGGLVENLLNVNKDIMVFAIVGGTITDPKIEKFSSSLVDEVKDEIKEIITEGLSEEAKKLIADAQLKAQKLIEDAEIQKQKLIDAAEIKAETLKTTAKKESDDVLAKAKTEGDALVAKAGNNPIAKKAAEKVAAEALVVAQKKADKILTDANKEIDKLVENAEKEGDKLIDSAEKEGDKLVEDATKKAENM
jgi:vacuolar-type H+-ATPase subunit H